MARAVGRQVLVEGPGSVPPTAERVLDSAQRLVGRAGYHAFSYADIAAELGITKASIHYHYPSKAELGRALVARYREQVWARVQQVGAAVTPEDRLRGYTRIFRDMLRGGAAGFGGAGSGGAGPGAREPGRLCLCGTLAPEMAGLPEAVQQEVRTFYDENEAWLADVLALGRERGDLLFLGSALVQAQGLLAGLEGAMQLAWVHADVQRYCAVAHQMLAHLGLPITELEINEPDLALSLPGPLVVRTPI